MSGRKKIFDERHLLQVSFEKEKYKKLSAIAYKQGYTFSAFIRLAVDEKVALLKQSRKI